MGVAVVGSYRGGSGSTLLGRNVSHGDVILEPAIVWLVGCEEYAKNVLSVVLRL